MIASLLLVAFAVCKYETEWNKFKIAYGKKYSTLENNERFKIFEDNMNYIALLNRIDKTATYGVTKFADLTAEEFAQKHLGFIPASKEGLPVFESDGVAAPDSYDWTTKKGYVSPVQDQGSCGSCWAFATTAGLETARVIAGNTLIKLSEQNLVDCDSSNSGCNGGNLSLAERYLKKTGIVTEANYPYAGVDQTCKVQSSWTKYNATGSGIISGENQIADALVKHGILPVAINANPVQFYNGGILDPSVCSPSGINHAVVVVGYGTEGGVDYWKIRNSWGASWGENGYFRMTRGKNTCGIGNDATYIDA